MRKFVASKKRETGKIEIHATPFECSNDFSTLCGMDIGLGSLEYDPTPLPRKPKINYAQCLNIWNSANKFTANDFKQAVKGGG